MANLKNGEWKKGFQLESNLETYLINNNIPFQREIRDRAVKPDFLLRSKVAIEITMNCDKMNLDSLCYRACKYLQYGYVSILILPFEKLRPMSRYVFEEFDFIFDLKDMERIIEILEGSFINYQKYLEDKVIQYSRLKRVFKTWLAKEWDFETKTIVINRLRKAFKF